MISATSRRVLIATLPLWGGGVRTMTLHVLRWLREAGYEPVLAYHQPHSIAPSLSVPAYALATKRPGHRQVRVADSETHEIGAWLPELEFMHYYPRQAWRTLIDTCAFHVTVSGSCLAAHPLTRSGRPFLSWIATPWREDRLDREARFGPLRRIWDRVLVRAPTQRLERMILRSPGQTLLALSEYTRRSFDRIAGRPVVAHTLPIPVETDLFRPEPGGVVAGRIGFSGRLSDPRKNISLFLRTIARLRERGHAVTGTLIGGSLSAADATLRSQLGLEAAVAVHQHHDRRELPKLLQTFDVFFVPSRQEGLCIAALEAMATGCPVVSTRCGGPEEFVTDGVTGHLVDFEASSAAAAIERLVVSRPARDQMGAAALALVRSRYSETNARSIFSASFEGTFERTAACRAS